MFDQRFVFWRKAASWGTLLVFILSIPVGETMAQTNEEPTDVVEEETTNPALKELEDEVARLTLEQQRAEALKAIAEANQAAFTASLPSTETTGKAGDVSIGDGAGYYGELLAYYTLSLGAEDISDRVAKNVEDKTVIVTDQQDLSEQAALWEVIQLKTQHFQDEFDRLNERFDKDGEPTGLDTESLTATAVTLTALLGSAADIAAFFKVDREIKNRTVTLSERALVAEVARLLEAGEVLLPDLALQGDRELINQLNAAQDQKRNEIETRLEAIQNKLVTATKKRDGLKTRWEKLKADKAPKADIEAAKKSLDAEQATVTELTNRKTRFESVITAFNAFFNALTTAPAEGAKSPLETVAVVDLVRAHSEALLLYVDVPSQGAEIHVAEGVFKSQISYVGGSVAVYFLVDQKGKVLAAGSLPYNESASFKGKEGSQTLPMVVPRSTP